MSYKDEIMIPITINNNFFDFRPQSGHPMIISYRYINKEMIFCKETEQVFISNIKKRNELYSIQEMKREFSRLLDQEIELVNRYGTYNIGINFDSSFLPGAKKEKHPFQIDIQSEDRELLINQLMFDILSDKYRAESPLMTLRQYSIYQSRYSWSGRQTEEKLRIDAVRKCISNALRKQIAVKNSPEQRKQIEKMGVDPDKYFEYYGQLSTPFSNMNKQEIKKKSKAQWDHIYYNANGKLITCKQYDRSFSTNGNYSHKDLVTLFDTYDSYIDEVFMQPTANSKDYFIKSLDFYSLEIYKRVDFIYKLAVRLENSNSLVVDKKHILVRQFHPDVCDVIEQNGLIKFNGDRTVWYKPMLMLEEMWQQKELYNEAMYEDKWQKYYFIRAKVYELFKYHFQFVSDDYDDISDFISKYYNILHYHEPKKVWVQNDKKRKVDREARIIKALEINEALFGDSDKRDSRIWAYDDN
ncbi:MAG: hypothetical protein K2J90_06840 [Lachnospiraceae bacterium]|nr:hypothetical protein [Lachnospiraceae bacterium]